MYRSTIDWNIQSGNISNIDKPQWMHSQVESQFSQRSKLITRANQILTVPNTRGQKRGTLNLDAIAKAL